MKTVTIDNTDTYNQMYGMETFHPLVSVFNVSESPKPDAISGERVMNYGVYALFLKNTRSCILNYGHRPYDYSDGTVVSFAPGQVVESKPIPGMSHDVEALLFHPDLIKGTSLGRHIHEYHFFDYASNEALHMSEAERRTYKECLHQIRQEVERPVDRFSRRLICQNIELLLNYCLRFYERQFITREDDNRSVVARFEKELNDYFYGKTVYMGGLPSVKYFAERCFLSPNYFGDLIKAQTGKSPKDYIQAKVIDVAKEQLKGSDRTITEIAYSLGFEYTQHFSRYFKKIVGMSPKEYREKEIA